MSHYKCVNVCVFTKHHDSRTDSIVRTCEQCGHVELESAPVTLVAMQSEQQREMVKLGGIQRWFR